MEERRTIMQWKNRNFKDLYEAVDYHTQGHASEMLEPYLPESEVQNADVMALWIQYYVQKGVPITIIGDYDADGIHAAAEMWLFLRELGADKIKIRLPKRFSEGYGLSPKIVEEINNGVIITVDNGITALEGIKMAKQKGLIVLVIDHHLPVRDKNGKILLPEADLIVNPMVEDALIAYGKMVNATYRNYCGAGLVLKVAEQLIKETSSYRKMQAMAAVATVADVMPLTGENRNIVKSGIEQMRIGNMTSGQTSLIKLLHSGYEITESDIGFKIAPMINAPGRLLDNGAEKSLQTLLASTETQGDIGALELQQLNVRRKALKDSAVRNAFSYIREHGLEQKNPIIICDPNIPEGIVGLVAGEIQEHFHMSAFVLTETENCLKGSARGRDEDNLKESLDKFATLYPEGLISYGGHKGAAGISLKKEALPVFKKTMDSIMLDPEEAFNELWYDLEINAAEIAEMCEEVRNFAPYGEGNPEPIFKINGFKLLPKGSMFYSALGSEGIKFYGDGCEAVSFEQFDRYLELGSPKELDMIGKLSFRNYMGAKTPQVEILDFRSREPVIKENDIQKAIAEQLFNIF